MTPEREALHAIMVALDTTRNRFGKLEIMPGAINTWEIQVLAKKYNIGGCEDAAEQCMKVAKAVLELK